MSSSLINCSMLMGPRVTWLFPAREIEELLCRAEHRVYGAAQEICHFLHDLIVLSLFQKVDHLIGWCPCDFEVMDN